MLLADLMTHWGRAQGLTEREVLVVVREHLFDRSGASGSGPLRFAVDSDAEGHVTLRVMPRRSSRGIPHGEEVARQPAKNHPSEPTPKAMPAMPRSMPATPRSMLARPVMVEVIEVPDDADFISVEPHGQARDRSSLTDRQKQLLAEKREEVHHRVSQMGLTQGTMHLRQGPSGHSCDERNGRRDRRACSVGEKVQRWIGWVLQRGHKELGLQVAEGGFGWLDELAVAMQRNRPDLGKHDTASLQALLRSSDEAGRFEVRDGRVRKLHRDARCRRLPEAPAPVREQPVARSEPGAGTSGPGRGRSLASQASTRSSRLSRASPSLSRSPSPAPDAGAALAVRCEQALHVTGDIEQLGAEEVDSSEKVAPLADKAGFTSDAPEFVVPSWPGKDRAVASGWEKFADTSEKGEQIFWFYFEGPSGKWAWSELNGLQQLSDDDFKDQPP